MIDSKHKVLMIYVPLLQVRYTRIPWGKIEFQYSNIKIRKNSLISEEKHILSHQRGSREKNQTSLKAKLIYRPQIYLVWKKARWNLVRNIIPKHGGQFVCEVLNQLTVQENNKVALLCLKSEACSYYLSFSDKHKKVKT